MTNTNENNLFYPLPLVALLLWFRLGKWQHYWKNLLYVSFFL